ncbi:AraC family transcriptional regulator [Streptomyces spiroverticillatus]|uniref:AraC family transcriptional regulator n=1 Tax=Streptomyces finlayi TaxID=67296 RepID=A0A918X5W1_9ACTN|nr:helix-turn-helix domain-containing protein [Streptomyces finlayi]GHA39686.1 AraC family transcriptional regulator [Streptomyces spiroverticillatus]GHD14493.1 AraC family transcriptional regulator [Streptomyces finlayi]
METVERAVPLHRLEVPAPQQLPFAIGSFDSIGALSRASFPHRHTFYEIVFVTSGRGAHVIDLSRWELRPPHLCFVVPGQVHYWENATDLHGRVILFTEDFLLDHPGDRDLLRALGERPWFSPAGDDAPAFARLVAELEREYRAGQEGFASVLRAYLHVLIVRASRLAGSVAPTPDPTGRPALVSQEFVRLLARPGPEVWEVRSCARRIGVTVGYLNEAVKQTTGRTPGQLVREVRTHEAKRLLVRTDLTVRQVAAEVGFADPAYFCRFFRRETGISPGEFRRGSGAMHHDYRIPSLAHPESPP